MTMAACRIVSEETPRIVAIYSLENHSMKSFFALLCLPFFAASVPAATIIPVSYFYEVTSPGSLNGNYADIHSLKLLDGVASVPSWSSAGNTVDATPMVGWNNSVPIIVFDFGKTVTIDSLTVWASHSDGAAGVYLPTLIVLDAENFTGSFSVGPNPSYSIGETHPLEVTGFSFTGQTLYVTVYPNLFAGWTMLTEVSFGGPISAVPEPSTYAAIAGALVLGLGVVRRRRMVANAKN